MHTVKIRTNQFVIPEWGMEKQFENHHVVIPLLKEPLVNGIALAGSEEGISESMFMATVLDGIMESLAQVDMLKVANILIDGVWYNVEGGKKKKATMANMQQDGLDISDVLILCIHVIKINYGAYLKKDLPDSLKSLFNLEEEAEGNPN